MLVIQSDPASPAAISSVGAVYGEAILPSSVIPALSVTRGVFVVMYLANASFNLRASHSSNPTWTWMPAARRPSNPLPATRGLGSDMAAYTRARPERTTASAHAAVRPV